MNSGFGGLSLHTLLRSLAAIESLIRIFGSDATLIRCFIVARKPPNISRQPETPLKLALKPTTRDFDSNALNPKPLNGLGLSKGLNPEPLNP